MCFKHGSSNKWILWVIRVTSYAVIMGVIVIHMILMLQRADIFYNLFYCKSLKINLLSDRLPLQQSNSSQLLALLSSTLASCQLTISWYCHEGGNSHWSQVPYTIISNNVHITSGVPQGSVLGQTLFFIIYKWLDWYFWTLKLCC